MPLQPRALRWLAMLFRSAQDFRQDVLLFWQWRLPKPGGPNPKPGDHVGMDFSINRPNFLEFRLLGLRETGHLSFQRVDNPVRLDSGLLILLELFLVIALDAVRGDNFN